MSPIREFILNKDIGANTVSEIINGINEVNKYDDEQSENKIKYDRKPIKLIVDSFGGEIYSGMTLVNIIDTSTTPIHTYCYGKAMSVGLIIFVVGHKRFAHPLATFMQHQLSGGTIDNLTAMIESLEQNVILQNMLDSLLVDKSKIKQSKLMSLRQTKTDWFFTGKEALELGVVDELIIRKGAE